jgi:hypothetical protein
MTARPWQAGRIHLDPVGGIAGDMLLAALLDAWPEFTAETAAAITAALPEVKITLEATNDHALTGSRLAIKAPVGPHPHRSLREIEALLRPSALAPAVKERACAILRLLAEAEATVHGVAPEAVVFHEVGALDSIADMVGAAFLIERLGCPEWSVGPLPLGSGRVQSGHGVLPVPAPAVVELLKGFRVYDDGLPGERVTPTGAAILRHLQPNQVAAPEAALLARAGIGFGTRRLAGLSNVLRVLAFEIVTGTGADERVALLSFEIDDQSPEDLAIGLERIRALQGVLDVIQIPAYGKKGRLVMQVQVLARLEAQDAARAACFAETTTLGLRQQIVSRATLPREAIFVTGRSGGVRVKRARRPDGGITVKAEADDVAPAGDRAARAALRNATEGRARQPGKRK